MKRKLCCYILNDMLFYFLFRCCLSGTSVTCVEKNDGTVTVLSLDDFSVMETKSLLNLGFHENDFASITTEAVTGILNAAVFTGKKLVVFHEEGEMVLSVGRDNCVWGGTEAESTKFLLVACQEREVSFFLSLCFYIQCFFGQDLGRVQDFFGGRGL